MRQVVKIFKALAESNRLRILKMLEIRPLCVCEITMILNLATSTVSKHLSILREADLIYDVKEGRWVNYYLNTKSDVNYIQQILPIVKKWLPNDAIIQEDLRKVKTIDRNFLYRG